MLDRQSHQSRMFGGMFSSPEWTFRQPGSEHGTSVMPSPKQDLLREIPSVDAVLQDPELEKFAAGVP